MKDLQKVNTDAIETTRTEVLKAIEPLTKGRPDKRKIEEANGKLTNLKKGFEKDGKVAQDAISFLDDSADEWEKSKDDKEGKKAFSPFLDAIAEFAATLDEAIEATKGDAMEEGKAEELKKTFTKLSNLKSTAKDAVNAAKRLKKAYDGAVK
jgi:DNA-binding ferritin-like protein